ncbi:MAG: LacI family DNA-binding transcriptional regulator [Planctomycetota bacterium]|nr:LacI family DNA-binding transcriptional regulator [Planctomycetota bacterium]
MAIRKRVTIYAVAKQAGVSPATVSKVLNNAHDVSEAARTTVQSVIAATGFVPREQQGRPNVLCVVIEQLPGHALDFGTYVGATLEGVTTYTREAGLELAIISNLGESADPLRDLRRRRAGAVLALRVGDGATWPSTVAAAGIPTLALHSDQHLLHCDESSVGALAARHLSSCGYRRVALLAAPPGNTAAEERIRGFESAWTGPRPIIRWSDPHHDARSFGSETCRRLLDDVHRPDAIFATDFGVAQGVLHGAWSLGITVGPELGVLSSDDYPEAEWTAPPLSTVGWSNTRVGALAAEQLHTCMRGDTPKRLLVPAEINPRASTLRPD